jgi:hypothetical protein
MHALQVHQQRRPVRKGELVVHVLSHRRPQTQLAAHVRLQRVLSHGVYIAVEGEELWVHLWTHRTRHVRGLHVRQQGLRVEKREIAELARGVYRHLQVRAESSGGREQLMLFGEERPAHQAARAQGMAPVLLMEVPP